MNMDPVYKDSEIFASHIFETTFNVFEILRLDDHLEKMVYVSNCAKYNSWEVYLKLSKQAPFNYFILLATLKRTDYSTLALEGNLVIWFKNQEGKTCPESYQVKCKLKGQQIQSDSFRIHSHLKCLLRQEDHITLPADLLIVRVELFVRGCCTQLIGDRSENINFHPIYENSEISASHIFETTFNISKILNVDYHLEEMIYGSNCAKYNSWEIGLKFSKQAPFNYFILLATLKRTDYTALALEGNLVIWLKNQEGKTCPAVYQVKCKLERQEIKSYTFAIHPHFECLLREGNHLILPDDMLIVRLKLFVRGCCTQPTHNEEVFNINMDPVYKDSRIFSSHIFETTFNVLKILSVEDHLEKMVYGSNCAKNNSWEIDLKFSKQALFNSFILFVTLKRTDYRTFAMKGILIIWFKNQEETTFPVSYHVKFKLKGQQIKRDSFAIDTNHKFFLRGGDYFARHGDLLIVRVELIVRGCCPPLIGDQTANIRMNTVCEDSSILASHIFETTFNVLEIRNVNDHSEKMVYGSNCSNYSSWEIHLTLSKQAPSNYFMLLVDLKRTDYSTFFVEGIVVIWFKKQEGEMSPASFQLKCKLKGRQTKSDSFVIDPHFKCLLQEGQHLSLSEVLTNVIVTLYLSGCCTHVIGDRSEAGEPT